MTRRFFRGSQTVRFEQAVYGSFPFWDRGYDVLARSPGCRAEWVLAFRRACQEFGEPPAGVEPAGDVLFTTKLERRLWLIAGVGFVGADDRGRPAALVFHGLFVAEREFRKAGFNPFQFERVLKREWSNGTRDLQSGSITVEQPAAVSRDFDAARLNSIVASLASGRRVALESDRPITHLARAVWDALPSRARTHASLATFAFSNASRFDLAAFPRLKGIELDATYGDPPSHLPRRSALFARPNWAIVAAAVAAFAFLYGTYAVWNRRPVDVPATGRIVATAAEAAQPHRDSYGEFPDDADARRLVYNALRELADRFGLNDVEDVNEITNPSILMKRFSDRTRYRGPVLSTADKARLSGEDAAGSKRALSWDARICRFLNDRPLPVDFESGPVRWQLDTLAWSFRVSPSRRLTDVEVVGLIGDSLAVDEPIDPIPLSARYPALSDYERFLARLPRR